MRFRLILFILLCFAGATAHSKEVNPDLLLRCIAEVESHNVSTKIGQQGERSRYQFMPQTWVMYSKVPFSQIGRFDNQTEVERVARRHIFTIKMALIQRGWEVTPYNIALGWNGGPSKLIYLPRHKDYAKRVENLYNSGPASM